MVVEIGDKMFIVETEKDGKWKQEPILFAEIEEAEKYAFRQVIERKCENARVVDEKYRGKK